MESAKAAAAAFRWRDLQALPYATCCIECQRKLEEYGHDGRSPIDWSLILGDDTNMAGMEMDFS